MSDLETRVGGRLGVAALDVHRGTRVAYRADERFPMCSTFKLLAVAAILARVDRSAEELARVVPYGQADLLAYAPVTEAHVRDGGMTVKALCEAAMTYSDNTAANLLLARLGGPAGLTDYARSLGDAVTRLDRIEPALNTAIPGDPRDTTSPAAMLEDMRRLLVTPGALSPVSQGRLISWMVDNTTGAGKLRAGLPSTWRVGDKTGTGAHGTTNDLAISWPPGRGPLLVAAYFTESAASDDERNGVLADVGRLVAAT